MMNREAKGEERVRSNMVSGQQPVASGRWSGGRGQFYSRIMHYALRIALYFCLLFFPFSFFLLPSSSAYHQLSDSDGSGNFFLVSWPTIPVNFVIDSGRTADGEDFRSVVEDSLKVWNDVSTARDIAGTVTLSSVDFTGSNLGSAWAIETDGINEIVLDSDGSALRRLGSEGALGISITIHDRSTRGNIRDAILVVNGQRASTTTSDLRATVIHELGHVWGLAHTVIGTQVKGLEIDGLDPVDEEGADPREGIPTMFPFAMPFNDRNGRTLCYDDIAGITEMYPETPLPNPQFGSISGTVKPEQGEGLRAVHVRAVNLANPNIQISRLSGFDGNRNGFYQINYLPPGDYKVLIEAIDNRAGVRGDNLEDDGIGAFTPIGFDDRYYNGAAGLSEKAPGTPVTVRVVGGQVTPDINFIVRFDATGVVTGTRYLIGAVDDSSIEVPFTMGFAFPFAGEVFSGVFISSNGVLSFGAAEPRNPAIRGPDISIQNFLNSNPPLIAGLWTDLDPGRRGFVIAEQRVDRFIVEYRNVREFAADNSNRLFITLKRDGTFEIRFEAIAALGRTSGDFKPIIVGYSFGRRFTSGAEQSTSLSGLTQPIGSRSEPAVFQFFNSSNFNLSNTTLSFIKVPNISISSTAVDFGQVNVTSSSSAQTINIVNTGNARLTVSRITVGGANPGDFRVNFPPSPFTVDPGGPNAGLSATFIPTALGQRAAALTLLSDDPDEPSITISIKGTGVDTQAPDVIITSPISGSTVSGTITVTADARDNVGVAAVQFLVDNQAFGPEIVAPPFSLSLDTRTLARGPHTLAAAARDQTGNVGRSQPLTIDVRNNRSPIVSALFDQTLSAGTVKLINFTATDPDGDALEVTVRGADFASIIDNGNGSYSLRLAPGHNDVGTFTLTVRVRDGQDNVRIEVKVTVTARRGDLTGDGTINIQDLIKLIQVLQGIEPQSAAADVDGNGRVDVQDLIRLIQALLGVDPL